MIFRKKISLAILLFAGISSVSGQRSVLLRTDEINLGKSLEIPILAPAARDAIIKEGYIIADTAGDKSCILQLKIATRQGGESQGIFSTFADVNIILKTRDGKIIDEKSIIGLKGAGLSYDHAGIDALRKSAGKVLPEVIQILNTHRNDLGLASSTVQPAHNQTVSNDAMPPEILISSPSLIRNAVAETIDPVIRIEGKVTDPGGILILTINGKTVPVSSSGTFSADLLVNEGITQVSVLAEDQNHNQASKVFSVSRTLDGQTDKIALNEPVTGQGRYFALIIGINDYEDPGITSLDNPIDDATALYETLTSYYTFDKGNVIFLKNPGRDKIIIALDELSRKITKSDNLLMFYAGHGLWDPKKRLGYWLPADAKLSNTPNWILNSTIKDMIAGIPSKHTLLVTDACFGGSIFKTRKAFNDAPPSVEKLYELPSRKAMTSGTMNEEVPDKSVFLEFLIKRLRENDQQYLSSQQLFTRFTEAVMNNSPITPQYGIIQDTGDEGGDFIFIKRTK